MTHYTSQKAFTLIETLVAIAILAAAVGALLTLAAGGYFSVRYAKNDIVANNLLQESIEYIRNNRDTNMHQGTEGWETWLTRLNVDTVGTQIPLGSGTRGCFGATGCTVDAYLGGANFKECSGACTPLLFYPSQQFYGYNESYPHISGGAAPYTTSFVRTIYAERSSVDPSQLLITATITWKNGTQNKTLSQKVIITDWTL